MGLGTRGCTTLSIDGDWGHVSPMRKEMKDMVLTSKCGTTSQYATVADYCTRQNAVQVTQFSKSFFSSQFRKKLISKSKVNAANDLSELSSPYRKFRIG